MFKWSEYERWMMQAERTLNSALRDLEGGDYEWASFKAQQAAELAVKALLRGMGFAPIGHSITKLLRNLRDEGIEVPRELFHRAMELDRNYIAPRYPDAYPEGSPFEYYSEDVAGEMISYAEEVINFVKRTAKNLAGD
ncbi:HEPN domain-containing protein [Thermococcus sp. Bubb.Bath]|uniref:HEPN domain-containing protein n=1 Tax=Thermococcus sp. Bubb.Bath TaxID=1638242 RepID=UPI00143C1684|nr:HEPN domain-containing protein [Thermococcus sp. Bubb.Bath]NJF25985.1 HEPN domain-containing protein [Thermococcus sp. Bubb.Bath]